MKHLNWILAFGIVLTVGGAPSVVDADVKKLFQDKQCTRCHSIVAEDIEKEVHPRTGRTRRGPDLSGLGLKGYDTDLLVRFVNRQTEKTSIYDESESVQHRHRYRGTEDELRKIISFLQTMKSDIVVEDDGEDED
jgi:hypothetical protein